MKTHIEIEVKLKGKYKHAQRETYTEPSWPAYIEDFEVWLGETNITEMIDQNQLDKLETAYLEDYESN